MREREREREHEQERGKEREGDTESEADSKLWAVSTETDTGLELTNREIMTRTKVGRLTDWATQAPQCLFILKRERETEHEWGRVREREGETQNPKQASGSELSAQSRTQGSNPQITTWAEADWATQAPHLAKVFFFNFFMFIYFWEREREKESMSRGGAKREGDTESEAGSRLWAVSTEPDVGLELTNCKIMTWAEVGRLNDRATQVPLNRNFS